MHVWLLVLPTHESSSFACLLPSSTAGSSGFFPYPPMGLGFPGHGHSHHLCLLSQMSSYLLFAIACCLYYCTSHIMHMQTSWRHMNEQQSLNLAIHQMFMHTCSPSPQECWLQLHQHSFFFLCTDWLDLHSTWSWPETYSPPPPALLFLCGGTAAYGDAPLT